MEAEDKSDTAILKQMKADLLKFERKIEEDKQKREARKATIARRLKEAMETRKAIQDANQQEREQTRREASQEHRVISTREPTPPKQAAPTNQINWQQMFLQFQQQMNQQMQQTQQQMQQQMQQTQQQMQQFQQTILQKLGPAPTTSQAMPEHEC
ncbi:vacuolar protein-sorting-associated protein 36-like [Ixodes scapularis]|uniref:vacuolar protein-sorting-associated protein 36-like n=1 Tax=Ixodes scapularis TaxID=6945 RepID=UPI001A9D268F|nr:vacuolar protein-sorting-associated protein 36-like [Ixodes scapularis]